MFLAEFMIYNNGIDTSNRMLDFDTDEGLCYLANSTTRFLNVIFNIAPSLFNKLYVIHAPSATLLSLVYTCIFFLLLYVFMVVSELKQVFLMSGDYVLGRFHTVGIFSEGIVSWGDYGPRGLYPFTIVS